MTGFFPILVSVLAQGGVEGCPESSRQVLIIDVSIITMADRGVLPSSELLVCGERIAAIGELDSVSSSDIDTVIDGEGGYLVPGLIDTHVHFFEDVWPTFDDSRTRYLAHGVTTVVNAWGRDDSDYYLRVRSGVRDGDLVGPTVHTAGDVIRRTSLDDARASVRRQAEAGFDFVKLYEPNPPEVVAAVLDEARAVSLPVIAHVTEGSGRGLVLEHSYAVAHLKELLPPSLSRVELNQSAIALLSDRVARDGVWVQTTLQAGHVDRNGIKALFAGLYVAGARLVLGTDTGEDGILPGEAVHRELELLVGAGLSNFEALALATSRAGDFLAPFDSVGTVSVGSRADLLILPGDPLSDLRALREITLVVVRGRPFNPELPRE